MLTALVLACVVTMPQRIDPPDRVRYPGDEVAARAIDRQGQPVAGLAVEIVDPTGEVVTRKTDAAGKVRFVPGVAGLFELRAKFTGGPQVFAVYRVATRPRRWLYAIVLFPLGLWLVVANVRRLRA